MTPVTFANTLYFTTGSKSEEQSKLPHSILQFRLSYYHCCGRNGSQDYILMGRSIPKNCYENEERTPNNLYTANCMEIIEETAFKSGRIGLAIKWILFFLEYVEEIAFLVGALKCGLKSLKSLPSSQYEHNTIRRYDGTTIDDTTIRRYDDTTIRRYNGTTIRRYDDTTVRR
ncbi:hypothetical protein DOY81_011091 [Sarcophaga bullata]|nr:hypothetical protein DOY81_011091 [Sarcophaga bullata]